MLTVQRTTHRRALSAGNAGTSGIDDDGNARQKKKKTTRVLDRDEKEVTLRRKIVLWQNVQRVYMPCVVSLLPPVPPSLVEDDLDDDELPTVSATDISLFLPSGIPPAMRQMACMPDLVKKETRLRIAQACDALTNLRRHLRIGATVFDHRKKQTAGTGTKRNTRMQTLLTRYTDKALLDAERYRAARAALMELEPDGDWAVRLPELKKEHVRPPHREAGQSEGRHNLSWIWLAGKGIRLENAAMDPSGVEVQDGVTEDAGEGEYNEGTYFPYNALHH